VSRHHDGCLFAGAFFFRRIFVASQVREEVSRLEESTATIKNLREQKFIYLPAVEQYHSPTLSAPGHPVHLSKHSKCRYAVSHPPYLFPAADRRARIAGRDFPHHKSVRMGVALRRRLLLMCVHSDKARHVNFMCQLQLRLWLDRTQTSPGILEKVLARTNQYETDV
jgi:hypothetical protein